ncbi:hypothetical protein HHI36_014301 [Cryptolaemus montrouzieri]|uniref:Uncharacterized protein n=1 Tax=Cryptolaemus montrouzieri TaxID=559131 RepID=A0ABD2N344_9CUCU
MTIRHVQQWGKHAEEKDTLIGDESAKKFRSLLIRLLDENEFEITASIRDNMETAGLVAEAFKESSIHGRQDFIIFMFNTIDVSHQKLLGKYLHNLLPIGRLKNLIIFADKTWPEEYRIIRDIHRNIKNFLRNIINCSPSFLGNGGKNKFQIANIAKFEYGIHRYKTRNRDNLHTEHHQINRLQVATNHHCIKLYNRLPITMRNLPIKHLISRATYTNNDNKSKILANNPIYSVDEFKNLTMNDGS